MSLDWGDFPRSTSAASASDICITLLRLVTLSPRTLHAPLLRPLHPFRSPRLHIPCKAAAHTSLVEGDLTHSPSESQAVGPFPRARSVKNLGRPLLSSPAPSLRTGHPPGVMQPAVFLLIALVAATSGANPSTCCLRFRLTTVKAIHMENHQRARCVNNSILEWQSRPQSRYRFFPCRRSLGGQASLSAHGNHLWQNRIERSLSQRRQRSKKHQLGGLPASGLPHSNSQKR
jgi:hypothetical protein